MTEIDPQDPVFERKPLEPGHLVRLSKRVARLIAPNGGPFTFTGTSSYLIGQKRLLILDPGPQNEAHLQALIAAVDGRHVQAILITHTHKDHSSGARALADLVKAPIYGCSPHVAARVRLSGEVPLLDAANDFDYLPERIIGEGEAIEGEDFDLIGVATPGHTVNHMCFALPQEQALFSGDHVMGWSTSIIAPPDGDMGAYMASLDKLLTRDDTVYWPGHGGAIDEPKRLVRGMLHHRRVREREILTQLQQGPSAIPQIAEQMYKGLDPRLKPASQLTIYAHIEDLLRRDLVACDDLPTFDAIYHLV